MTYSEEALSTLRNFREKSGDPACQRQAGVLYWNLIEECVFSCIREKRDLSEMLGQEYDLFNFGISPVVRDDAEALGATMRGAGTAGGHFNIFLVTDWIMESYQKTISGDRIESLERELKVAEQQHSRHEQEIRNQQQLRRELLLRERGGQAEMIELLEQADSMSRYILKIKRRTAKGAFLSVDEKRKNCRIQMDYEKLNARTGRIGGSVSSPEVKSALKQCTEQIEEHTLGALDNEELVARIKEDLSNIQAQQHALSSMEIEAALRKEFDYIRDMVKLAAKRLRLESSCFMKPGETAAGVADVNECIGRILEFDPEIVHNQRVVLFGLPGILLVPGNGRALYEWKSNRIIVPLFTPDGNLMASIATSMIEYRLDTDEEKKLLTTYNELPRHKGVKSVIRLKNDLIKEYLIWMTSEYNGYKVLPKEERRWFEQEIAPAKNDISVPLECRPYMMHTEEFNRKCRETDTVLAGGTATIPPETLWIASVLLFQQGKFKESMECLEALVQKQPDNKMAWYNLGHVCMKLMRKQEALRYFTEFCKRNPQSWWASVAMEHVRRLQMGGSG
jgi:tetratricopeptide (TPR) repeat protein